MCATQGYREPMTDNRSDGLPLEPLRPVLKKQIADQAEPEVLRMDAINRRGRAITVQVTVSKLQHPEYDGTTGALLTVDVVGG